MSRPKARKKRKIVVEILVRIEVDPEESSVIEETLDSCREYGSAEVINTDVLL